MQMFCCIFFLFYNNTIVAIEVMHLTSVQLVFPKAGPATYYRVYCKVAKL